MSWYIMAGPSLLTKEGREFYCAPTEPTYNYPGPSAFWADRIRGAAEFDTTEKAEAFVKLIDAFHHSPPSGHRVATLDEAMERLIQREIQI